MPIRDEMISALRHLFRASGSGSGTASASDPEQAPAETPPAADPIAGLLVDERVPKNCREKASTLVSAIDLILGRVPQDTLFDPRTVELDRLRAVHLPQLLQRYVDIPPEHRAEIFRKTEKSASYHLAAALDVMAKRVSEISLDLSAGVLDEFTIGARFVETRYGHSEDPFA